MKSKNKIIASQTKNLKRHSKNLISRKKVQAIEAVNRGNQLMEVDQFDEAVKAYSIAVELQPNDIVALSNLGAALIRCGRIAEAEVILEYTLEIDPKNYNARINLGSVFQAKKDYHGAIKNALEAITLDPTSARAFNNLGCAFGCVMMLDEALHAYQTAQQLDPEYLEASLNVCMTLADMGKPTEALSSYTDLLKKIPKGRTELTEIVKFYMSFLYLQTGDLSTGWNYYESGFSTAIPIGAARSPNRKFSCPQWQGENLNGLSLIVWREQGIGDEILFSSCMVDLIKYSTNITFECSQRLVEIYRRSFPKFRVRSEKFDITTGLPLDDESYDYHISLGSLPKVLRRNISDFNNQKPFIRVDENHKKDFDNRLKNFHNQKLIGICWRSGLLDPNRNIGYTMLSDWGDILTNRNYKFVSLQYGDCEAELAQVEKTFNIEILRWNDLDLKNDLDRVFALISCLDFVISAPTAVNCMAGSLGITTLYLGNKGWPNLGAPTGVYPWFPKTICCDYPLGQSAASALPQVPEILKSLS